VARARVATLATIGPDGRPQLVPMVFAYDGATVYAAVDHKPKRTRELARLANIERDPRVTLLVHHYDEDWSALWWVRLEGTARVVREGAELAEALRALEAKYPQYREATIEGPAIVAAVTEATGWHA
jgi:PPOX class probable F420-dependent enzyme